MKVSIRTAYRIVKKTENQDCEPIFIPQYQEEGSEDWHIFDNRVGSGGYNTIYFYVLSKAIDYLSHQKALEDAVVYYRTRQWNGRKTSPTGLRAQLRPIHGQQSDPTPQLE
jgi:hypothetical protein